MAIRLSGMNSGLDTEAIISELVKAKSVKKDNLVKAQTKLQWKQDAWKELNSKIYNFYTKTLDGMRLQSDYTKKVTESSNSSAVDIITGSNAVDGVQTMTVEKLAKSGYLTGAEISLNSGTGKVSGSTKLSDLKNIGTLSGKKLTVTVGGKAEEIELTEDMTVDGLVSALKSKGLNASFDANNQRFFVSSKETGAASNFTIECDGCKDGTASSTSDIMKALGFADGDSHKTDGQDAEIKLNGATFKSSTNTFEINGLTITAKAETSEAFTITTKQDTDGIYDMVRNFFKEYNAIINELDALYNADSSKGYEPLTDEEKEAMSESEIEKWEEKIKDSLLRKDSDVNKVASTMKQMMMQGVTMADGTKKYLSDYGINTLGYFNAADNEKGAYHIDGDPDNTNTSSNADKLKTAIANNPEEVTEFFSSLTRALYDKLFDMMKSTDYSSSFTLYEDKAMKEEYDDYTEKIKLQEEKIADYENRYYKKFTAMEKALAMLQSKESAIAGMLGM